MNPRSLSALCMRCRVSIYHRKPVDSWLFLAQRRYYQSTPPINELDTWKGRAQHNEPRKPAAQGPRGTFNWETGRKNPPQFKPHFRQDPKASAFLTPDTWVVPPQIKSEEVTHHFETKVREWVDGPVTHERLLSFGIPEEDLQPLLDAFVAAVESKSLSTPENQAFYELDRFSDSVQHRQSTSVIYCSVFYWWATQPSQQQLLLEQYKIQDSTLRQMKGLVDATNRQYLSDEFPETRRFHRKVIMHVGPTNSGKTHHALRALAAAKSGVYAGPLRLLAHEIWERLNLGTIEPLGAEEGTFVNEDKETVAALPHYEMVKQLGNPEWARITNMITGEEQKIVATDGQALLSCTVEMLGSTHQYDVAVVDEIQMITDTQRGSAWTSAVLGIAARELHLCGEETAVPIVEALLKDTGDELIVKRYERLTPLTIEEESLRGDWSKIQKGDAIVVFSRNGLFAVRRHVENTTGLRCAVVYGRLPPEIRSEQARLFNDPNSGYDVLVGSDAIGMGLNLKIRRIIFDSVRKFGTGGKSLLSISQVKQIAGRAGRFGLHAEPGGYATTLQEEDLPYLRQAVSSPFTPLPFARITFDAATFYNLIPVLPDGSSTSTIIYAHHYVGRLPREVRYQEGDFDMINTFDFIDQYADYLTVRERVLHLNAPIAWRDSALVDVVRAFLGQARDNMYVDILQGLRRTNFVSTMEWIEKSMKDKHIPRSTLRDLSILETFHKALVLYIWMSFRAPVMYPQFELAHSLKVRLEKVLEWSLEGMSDSSYIRRMRDKVKLKEANLSSPRVPRAQIAHARKKVHRTAVLNFTGTNAPKSTAT